MPKAVTYGKTERMSFARHEEIQSMPNLLEIQKNSYKWFLEEGLRDVFKDVDVITDYSGNLELRFVDYSMDENPKYTEEECKARDATYAAPLKVSVRLRNKETEEIKEQEIFMGDFPIMTPSGTFVINGAERVIVSQIVRSPGVYYDKKTDKAYNSTYGTTVIPYHGAWLEYETDLNDIFNCRIDKNRKLPVTWFIKAMGAYKADNPNTWLSCIPDMTTGVVTNEQIKEVFDNDARIVATLDKDTCNSREEALVEIYRKLRPGDPPTVESSETLLEGLFYDRRRYDISNVGRYKFNKKLGLRGRIAGFALAAPVADPMTGEILAEAGEVLTRERAEEIAEAGVNDVYLDVDGKSIRVFGNGMVDMKHYVDFDPAELGVKELVRGVILRQLMEQYEGDALKEAIEENLDLLIPKHIIADDMFASINYLCCLAHGIGEPDDIDHLGNRRVRSVGELLQNQFRIGFSRMERVIRERMTLQDLDVVTPQSLINIRPVTASIKEFFGSSPLSQFMDQTNPLAELTHKRRISALGPGGLSRERASFDVRDVHYSHYGRMCPIETPEGPNIGLISYLASYARVNEYGFLVTPFRRVEKGTCRVTDDVEYMTADVEDRYIVAQASEPVDENGCLINERITCRHRDEIVEVDRDRVDYIDISPRMMVSIATAMIPFLENDDANRALMGANMQRQAVPLMVTEAPIVATGIEHKLCVDSGVVILAEDDGLVMAVSADSVKVRYDSGEIKDYKLIKFARSNQGTCINQRPIVAVGDRLNKGDVIADGPATSQGEIALGKNLLVGFMTWEGYNYEDAVLINERLVMEDVYTSIHIEEFECDARDTKLGPEEITRDIPGVGDDALKYLDDRGIICVGAEVRSGDILVGKVTPKGETDLTAEERLLRAIFGAKAHDVRDTSLKMPHGAYGRVIDVVRFSRENGDDLAPGVNEQVRVYVAQRRKIQQGDKIAGRHGNKGVICNVLPVEDMPYMADGTPIDVILNPLGVPSRMNVGQLLECHLGWAAACGWDTEDADSDKYVPGPFFVSTPVFDGAKEDEIAEVIRRANKNMLNKATAAFGDHMRPEFVTQLDERGKTRLFDGRTGEEFREPITVGTSYILKLGHMVDDKIHARSTGPYSLVTQQPLGGKAQFGGQRFGEMEVWALYAYGAANVLQEILTVKSDDTVGRVKTYESIVKGENVPVPGIPESFKVLVKEIRSLALDIEPMHDADEDASAPVTAEETSALDDLAALAGVDTDVEAQDAETAEAPEAVAATTTDKE